MSNEQQAPSEDIQLTFEDIHDAARIIEAALERSTFKAGELSGVAAVYDRFAAFVNAQISDQEAEAPTEDDAE